VASLQPVSDCEIAVVVDPVASVGSVPYLKVADVIRSLFGTIVPARVAVVVVGPDEGDDAAATVGGFFPATDEVVTAESIV